LSKQGRNPEENTKKNRTVKDKKELEKERHAGGQQSEGKRRKVQKQLGGNKED